MTAGWIYVLVNSSMPGLVKVGKTTRNHAQRADELSSVTGIATPFVVAFDRHFQDCDQAETLVHSELARRGHRVAANREFFRSSSGDVIRVVLAIDDKRFGAAGEPPAPTISGDLGKQSNPWDAIHTDALFHYLGHGNYIQDNKIALRLFKEAAGLGSLSAYEHMATIHLENGDTERAMDILQIGVEKGNYNCYIDMAEHYNVIGNQDNRRKCFDTFFEKRQQMLASVTQPGHAFQAELEMGEKFANHAALYLTLVAHKPDWVVSDAAIMQLFLQRSEILEKVRALPSSRLDILLTVEGWIKNNMFNETATAMLNQWQMDTATAQIYPSTPGIDPTNFFA